MNENSTIDNSFKSQLTELEFNQKDNMWQKMNQQLDDVSARDKRRRLIWFWIPLLALLIGSVPLYKYLAGGTKEPDKKNDQSSIGSQPTQVKEPIQSSTANSSSVLAPENDQTAVIIRSSQVQTPVFHPAKNSNNPIITGSRDEYSLSDRSALNDPSRTNVKVFSPVPAEDLAIEAGNEKKLEVTNAFPLVIDKVEKMIPVTAEKEKNNPVPPASNTVSTDKKNPKKGKYSVGFDAGSDVFNRRGSIGYYAGASVEKQLNSKVSISAGIGFSQHSLSINYKDANKALGNSQTVHARLEGVKMVRFPVVYKQHIGNSRFTASAGLVPVYVVDANIYNVPGSYNSNPNLFREFTINDIHRLNVLFNAGLNIRITNHLSTELNGNYGLTELVKNSYINQTRTRDNFRNLQVGIVYRIK